MTQKQTSIEWLAQALLNSEPNVLEWQKYLLQAKEMHKQEIIDAWENAPTYLEDKSGEDYYNETFNSEIPNVSNYCDCEPQTYYQWEMQENKCNKCNKKIYTEEELLQQNDVREDDVEKSAIEFLVDELIKLGYLHSKEHGQSPIVNKYIRQAKQMELKAKENTYTKEQLIKAISMAKGEDGNENYDVFQYTTHEIIQSLKQPK